MRFSVVFTETFVVFTVAPQLFITLCWLVEIDNQSSHQTLDTNSTDGTQPVTFKFTNRLKLTILLKIIHLLAAKYLFKGLLVQFIDRHFNAHTKIYLTIYLEKPSLALI